MLEGYFGIGPWCHLCPFDNSQSSCCGIMYFRVWQCDDKRRHVIRKIGGKSGVDPHTEPNCPSQPCQRHHRQKCNCLIFFSGVKIIILCFSRFGTPGYMLELIEHEFLKKVSILNELFHLPIGVYHFIHPPLCPSSPRSVSLYSPPHCPSSQTS